MNRIIIGISFLLITNFTFGQVTFSGEIADIIYNNCSNCHREGQIGPFPLTNYEEVSERANMIQFVTESKYMPPWQADPSYSNFLGETYLTQDEIDLISEWVENGAPRGDQTQEPAFPEFPDNSLLGEPDMVLTMEQAHLHKGRNRDSYYYFVLPTNLTEDKVVKAVEFRAGNTKIVHHALIFEDTKGIARATDAQTPEYGFESFGGFNGDDNDLEFLDEKQFPPYAPGQKALKYPDGLGQVLKAGSDIAVQIHYAPTSVDEFDQSSINFFFADEDEEVDRIVDNDILLPFNLPGGFFSFSIPPNQERTFQGHWNITEDLSILGVFPHSHLLGKEWEAWVEHTDGTRTNLISIPDWDFNWQYVYYLNRFVKAERGSRVVARAVYDNTVNNPNNPSNPPQLVFWGENTTDEMYYMPFLYVPYQDGDEDIIFNDGLSSTAELPQASNGNHIINISPNPSDGLTSIDFQIKNGGPINIQIFDLNGRRVRNLAEGEFYQSGLHTVQFRADRLKESGTYVVLIQGKEFNLSQSFIKLD